MKHILFILGLSFLFSLPAVCQSEINNKLKPALANLSTGNLAEAGLQADSIEQLIHLINTNPPNDFRGMVIIKDDKIVVEEYFNTYWRATIHDIRSAAKSITALLLGIAIDKGLVKSVEQSIYDFFPADKFPAAPTQQHLTLKIKHLLNMTAGLDANADYPNTAGHAFNWIASDDWVSQLLSIPMDTIPGAQWAYTDACAMLIGAIIEEASGLSLAVFAEQYLFTPLEISEYYWFKSPRNRTGAMGNLYISTLDFAKIGQLVLNQGNWRGQRIISETWIEEIAKTRVNITDTNPFANGYGYLWYKSSKNINGQEYKYFFASGMGGNVLMVVPEENMVVGLTSSAYGQDYGHFRSDNIFKFILKALDSF